MPSDCEEVVADSEDEISPYSVGQQHQMASVGGLASTVSSTETAPVGTTGDNISCFTENPTLKSAETSISSFAPIASRPRPRPAYKGAGAIANAISSIGTSPSIPSIHSLLPGASATSFPGLNRDVQMGSSNPASSNSPRPDASFSFDIAERAKMRSRNASKLTPSISLISPPPIPRPRPRPRPKPKRVSTSKIPAPEVINLTSGEEDELALPPLKPLLKSSAKSKPSPKSASKRVNSSRPAAVSPAASLTTTRPASVSSPLPPSDAPPSIAPDQEHDHPPIAVLPDDSDGDIFLSSPPLFSSPPAQGRKRKRPEAPSFDLQSDIGDNMDVDAHTMPPPPQFFGSSSSDMQGSLPLPPPPFFAPSSPLVNDSGIEINGPVPVSSMPGAKKPTAKKTAANQEDPKKVKKKQNVDDDDFELDTDRPRKKTKPEAKTKKGGKKSVDVDPKASKVFKSNEFIDDDADREAGPVEDRLATTVPTPDFGTTVSSAKPQLEVPDLNSGVREKKGKKKVTTEIVVTKRKQQKGKPVVSSEGEDADGVVGGDARGEPVVNKSDQASNGKGKEKEKTGHAAERPDLDVGKPAHRNDELEGTDNATKENRPTVHNATPPATTPKQPAPPPASRSYSIASRTKSKPMSDLIRHVNSLPGSPFAANPHHGPVTPSTAYSPYLKSSRSALSRIAPLHPNRRTPPPPLPRPPPPRKSKKQLEKEERWEEELQEGVEGWATLTGEERAAMRRAKRAIDEGWED